jgi:uncharacterized protein YcbK (DUF882 family)
MKTKISKNFTFEELVRTSTGYLNAPVNEQEINLRLLTAGILQPLRSYLNEKVVINSGYRSAQVNSEVGGSNNSFHLHGMAADIKVKSFHKAVDFIRDYLEFTELGIYHTETGIIRFLHVAYDPLNLSKEVFFKTVK